MSDVYSTLTSGVNYCCSAALVGVRPSASRPWCDRPVFVTFRGLTGADVGCHFHARGALSGLSVNNNMRV